MSWWKSGMPAAVVYILTLTPTFSQISSDRAFVVAANFARTCYVEMLDGQIKCGGRPQRSLSSAKTLLSPGRLVEGGEPSICNTSKTIWVFKWRAFPEKAPVIVDAQTGKRMGTGREC
jgi:hypothetical protein